MKKTQQSGADSVPAVDPYRGRPRRQSMSGVTGLVLGPDVIERLDTLAVQESRTYGYPISRSAIIRRAVAEFLARHAPSAEVAP